VTFPILNDIEIALKSKDMIDILTIRCEELSLSVRDSADKVNLPYFLEVLLKTATSNFGREKEGYRYEDDLKEVATYLFILGGPVLYEFLSSNLSGALPSLRTVQKSVSTSSLAVKEGEFRFEELKQYLIKNNWPLKVWISEDGTRITPNFSTTDVVFK